MNDIVALIKGSLIDGRRISDADALAAAEEIARLRGLLKARDGGAHDAFCATKRPRRWGRGPCTCGHDEVVAYFREIEG